MKQHLQNTGKPLPYAEEIPDLIKPLHDLVLLEIIEKSEGLIILPQIAQKDEQQAVVIDVGPGRQSEYKESLIMPCVKPGDRVFFNPTNLVPLAYQGRKLILIQSINIMGVYPSIPNFPKGSLTQYNESEASQ